VAVRGRTREHGMTRHAVDGTRGGDYWTFVVCAIACGATQKRPSGGALDAQLDRHPYELGQRRRAHFFHDARAMHLDGLLAGAKAVRDELVRQTGDDESHHLALARREAPVASAEVVPLAADRALKRVAGERSTHRRHQQFRTYRLREK